MSATRGPRLVLLREASANVDAQTVSLLLESASGKTYRMPFAASCIPMVVAGLAAEFAKLKAALPPGEVPMLQDVRGGITVGVRPDRTAVLILALQGVELPLTLNRKELVNLRTGINDALMMIDRTAQGIN
ncbi:hypothetical protein [Mesorhizobium sp. L-8-3]|uniref:hypothetical protein n=1 Tax=Mesorhizobium sp. L-8-3 TaxID=2744522 RepID=UPI001925EC6F|nr:hypothetical protein [Mesorhizobium sp. L-8-3]BCH25200.1 hypothetical protein MesoLjLb_49850 [Mesorhizobium sp. L-8-3]